MAPTVGADQRIGTELAGYRIDDALGRGGMSVVYLALDLALDRKVALKLMAPELAEDRRFRERFRRESRLAASVDHPNVIPVYDAGEADGLLYIAMRYVEGSDLKSLLAREGRLEPNRTLGLLSQVAWGLDAAHARGLVHRDVKPSNILLAGPEGEEHVYLADFGLTRTQVEEDQSESLQLSGTVDYVSPEQITGETIGSSSDLYSLGCVLYHCLTGRVPYPRDKELAVLWAHVDEPPPRPTEVLPTLPRAVDDVIARALSKEPDARYETAGDLVEAAQLAFPRGRRRWRPLLAASAIVAALAVAVSVVAVMRGGDESRTRPTLALSSGAVQRVDPQTNELEATIHVGGEPVDIAAGAGGVWLADAAHNTLVRIDPATAALTRRGSDVGALSTVLTVPSIVGTVADGPNGIVLQDFDPQNLRSIGAWLLRSTPSFQGDPAPSALSVAGDFAVTLSRGRWSTWNIDRAWGTLIQTREGAGRTTVETGGVPVGLAAVGQEVWVAQTGEAPGRERGKIVRVDSDGDVMATVPLGFEPSGIAAGDAGVWVADRRGQRAWVIDPQTESSTPVPLGGPPVDIAVGEGAVWVLTGARGRLVRIDPVDLEVAAAIEIGTNPTALAVGEDGVWVALGGGEPWSVARFPRHYRDRGPGYTIDGFEPGRAGASCGDGLPVRDCVVLISTNLATEEGTSARLRFAMRQRRREGGSVKCQGTIPNDPVTSEVRGDAGAGRLEVEGWGIIALRIEHIVETFSSLVTVVNSDDPGFRCGQHEGTWVGVRGRIAGESGTFTTFDEGREGITLTLRS
jgi:DNA-binding beta-propeller fold protein YncE/tRNA A-37 threonylcarbamoyl transferase component Bud32